MDEPKTDSQKDSKQQANAKESSVDWGEAVEEYEKAHPEHSVLFEQSRSKRDEEFSQSSRSNFNNRERPNSKFRSQQHGANNRQNRSTGPRAIRKTRQDEVPAEQQRRTGGLLKVSMDTASALRNETTVDSDIKPLNFKDSSGKNEWPSLPNDRRPPNNQRRLFNPSNPSEPIMVPHQGSRHAAPQHRPMNQPARSPDFYAPMSLNSDMMYGTRPPLLGGSSGDLPPPFQQGLMQAHALENQICGLMKNVQNTKECVRELFSLRDELQQILSSLLLMAPDVAISSGVDQNLWKGAFYQVIETLRWRIGHSQYGERLKPVLVSVLDQGLEFYVTLLKAVEEKSSCRVDDIIKPTYQPAHDMIKRSQMTRLIGHRLLLAIGDLHRYREMANGGTNFGKSRHWYLKASQLAPKSGRPYNQLAILASYVRRFQEAVFYYVRSLAVKVPVLTARENLMGIFNEVTKRHEQIESRREDERRKRVERRRTGSGGGGGAENRVEIWVSADGSSHRDLVVQDADERLSDLSPSEVNHRFRLSFLTIHGKLFSKIGMENYPSLCARLLREHSHLLSLGSDSPLDSNRLLQLLAINMFMIDNTALKETGRGETEMRSVLQEAAVQLGLDMFSQAVSALRTALNQTCQKGTDIKYCVLSADVNRLTPAVAVWCRWMMYQLDTWYPPPVVRDPELGPDPGLWDTLASAGNLLRSITTDSVQLSTQSGEDMVPVLLSEDQQLSGFSYLIPDEPVYVHRSENQASAALCVRLNSLRDLVEILCGLEPQPVLRYNVSSKQYVPLVQSVVSEKRVEARQQPCADDENSDVEIESETILSSPEVGGELSELRKRKELLEREVQQRQQVQDTRQALLEGEQCGLELEITPQYLVPDTNAFIDLLPAIQRLVRARRYTLVVPLVVIGELDGLSRGARTDTRAWQRYEATEGEGTVAQWASKAIEFLEAEFECRNSHLQAITAQGNLLDSIAFRSEERTSSGNNDDIILSCCLHFCNDRARDFMPKEKGTPIRLQRHVVLLTDDRNLRVKALSRNVPVKTLPAFMRWARMDS